MGFGSAYQVFKIFSFTIIGHLKKDAKISVQSFVVEHVQESLKILTETPCSTKIALTILKSCFVHGGANVTRADYDDTHGSVRGKIETGNVLRVVFCKQLTRAYTVAPFQSSSRPR